MDVNAANVISKNGVLTATGKNIERYAIKEGYAYTGLWDGLKFDASAGNSIYVNSDTVQPNSLTCRFYIKF